ncbi:hypothetical protein BDR07DRAFT_1378123 [Suillus spraguei]|nr:hypothetical protein BDR07DRAFT_1378123 [Suillus spraguei]
MYAVLCNCQGRECGFKVALAPRYGAFDPNYESLLPVLTASGASSSRIIGDVVGAITPLVAVVSMWYINEVVSKMKLRVIQERQKSHPSLDLNLRGLLCRESVERIVQKACVNIENRGEGNRLEGLPYGDMYNGLQKFRNRLGFDVNSMVIGWVPALYSTA